MSAPTPEQAAFDGLIEGSGILTQLDVILLQLVEAGLCRWCEFKDGSLNFRDILKMKEYLKVKNDFLDWTYQRKEQERKARNLIKG